MGTFGRGMDGIDFFFCSINYMYIENRQLLAYRPGAMSAFYRLDLTDGQLGSLFEHFTKNFSYTG